MKYHVSRNRITGELEVQVELVRDRKSLKGPKVVFDRADGVKSIEAAEAAFVNRHGSQGKLKLEQVKRGGQ